MKGILHHATDPMHLPVENDLVNIPALLYWKRQKAGQGLGISISYEGKLLMYYGLDCDQHNRSHFSAGK